MFKFNELMIKEIIYIISLIVVRLYKYVNEYWKFGKGRLEIANRGQTAGMSGKQASWRDARSKSRIVVEFLFLDAFATFGENSGEPNRSLSLEMKSVDRVEWMQLVSRWTMLVNTSCAFTTNNKLYYRIHVHIRIIALCRFHWINSETSDHSISKPK